MLCKWLPVHGKFKFSFLEHSGIFFSISDLRLVDSVIMAPADKGADHQLLHQSDPWAPADAAQVRSRSRNATLKPRFTAMETCNNSCSYDFLKTVTRYYAYIILKAQLEIWH